VKEALGIETKEEGMELRNIKYKYIYVSSHIYSSLFNYEFYLIVKSHWTILVVGNHSYSI